MARRLAFDALTLVEEKGLRAREALDQVIGAASSPDPRDVDLASDIVQGVLRTEIQLDAVISQRIPRLLSEQDPDVLRVLRIGAYQLIHLDRIPPWAVVSTGVALTESIRRERAKGFVNAVLRRISELMLPVTADPSDDPRRSLPRGDGSWRPLADAILPHPNAGMAVHLACRWGVPVWIVARFLTQHGHANTVQILSASISRPSLAVRPRADRALDFEAALSAAGIAFEHEGPCLLLTDAPRVPELPGFAAGDFAVQDPTSADVVPLLDPKAGERVLDTCAAPGGKSFAIAELVGPTGHVMAMDLPGPRLDKMQRERDRRRATNVEVVGADAGNAHVLPGLPFDAVLVDAPCSNTGVLARRVEARHRLSGPSPLDALVEIQARVLRTASQHVRVGGRLVYSTCSVDRDENAEQVAQFLASPRGAGFTLVTSRETLPVPRRRDGGYVALLRRVSSTAEVT